MRYRSILMAIVALALAAAACTSPVSSSDLPKPGADHAYHLSFRGCRTAVKDYTLKRIAKRLDATGTRPRQLARAYVRKALHLTTGWRSYRVQGFRGCLAGIRAGLSARSPTPSQSPEVSPSPSESPSPN